MKLQEIKDKGVLEYLNKAFFKQHKRKPKNGDIETIIWEGRQQLNQYTNNKWYAVNFMSCKCCEE